MKKLVRVILMGILALSLCGCGGESDPKREIKYNAVLYDNAQKWMTEEYLRENMTLGSRIPVPPYGYAEEAPKEISHMITTQEEFDRAFAEFPVEVNFEEEILVVYFFTDIYMAFGCELQEVTDAEQCLQIDILHKLAPIDDRWGGDARQAHLCRLYEVW